MGKNLYSTGTFAKKANVSVRTIQYYEKKGLIYPKEIGENGYRYYGEDEFARLQRILTLKLLGFSLEEIRELSLHESNTDYVQHSFDLQLSLVRKKIEHLQAVEESIQNASRMFREKEQPDWNEITKLIQIINMDRDLVEQYQNGKNIDARISLHSRFSENPQSWFSWIYEHYKLRGGEKVLELGCGNGSLWRENVARLPKSVSVLLTDISPGMLEDSQAALQSAVCHAFSYEVMDCHQIEKASNSYDLIAANFVLFYLRDLGQALSEIRRVLRNSGRFVCATYGKEHMKEVEQMVQQFNPKVHLSPVSLYDNFGLENGKELLEQYFEKVTMFEYPDRLRVTEAQPLVDYIMSCHGNQKEYLVPEYEGLQQFVEEKLAKKGYISVTKQAGIFVCERPRSGKEGGRER